MVAQITKSFRFEAAHILVNHQGKCGNLHGHSYKLEITCEGPIHGLEGSAVEGMVTDFQDLSSVVKDYVVQRLDHAFIASSEKQGRQVTKAAQPDDDSMRKFVSIGMPTTAENIALWCFEILRPHLSDELDVQLVKVRLWETETGYAEITA